MYSSESGRFKDGPFNLSRDMWSYFEHEHISPISNVTDTTNASEEEENSDGSAGSGDSEDDQEDALSKRSEIPEDEEDLDDDDIDDALGSDKAEDSSDGETGSSGKRAHSKRRGLISDTLGDIAKAARDNTIERKSEIMRTLPTVQDDDTSTENQAEGSADQQSKHKNTTALKNLFNALAEADTGSGTEDASGAETKKDDQKKAEVVSKPVSSKLC